MNACALSVNDDDAADAMTAVAMTRLLEIEARVRPITVRGARPFEPGASRIMIRACAPEAVLSIG